MGLNRNLINKTYPEKEYTVERDAMLAYARAINEKNPLFTDSDTATAAPMFCVVWWLPAALEIFFDQELIADAQIGRMVHSRQAAEFYKPVGPLDVLRTIARVKDIAERGSGEELSVEFVTHNQAGDKVTKITSNFYFRGHPDPNRVPRAATPAEIGEILFEERLHIDDDQTYRYAKASGDHNPIHVDPEMAKNMGFPGIIVHGLCVMALAQKAVIDRALNGDPAKLRRLAVKFSKPVFPGDDLTWIAWEDDSSKATRRLGFVMKSQRGEQVIREGVVELV
jgi:acyl dehydratase